MNVTHTEGDLSLPRLYSKEKPLVIDDFINFLREKLGWYEKQALMDRDLSAAFGK